jgi:hypothetical protein
MDDIAPSTELSTISMATILGEDGKGANLPWSRSQWINQHLNHLKNDLKDKPIKAARDKLWVRRVHSTQYGTEAVSEKCCSTSPACSLSSE